MERKPLKMKKQSDLNTKINGSNKLRKQMENRVVIE
jgi:hypothetical protein